MSIGLYIGRFQPFHLGHLSAIKQALGKVDKLIIGIGSSQYEGQEKNPYSADKRQEMLELGLKETGLLEQCEIYQIPDIHDDEKWVSHVKSIVPEFETVFVGNDGIVKELFEKAGTPIQKVEHELDISATKIRELMENGGNWQGMVSPSVANHLA